MARNRVSKRREDAELSLYTPQPLQLSFSTPRPIPTSETQPLSRSRLVEYSCDESESEDDELRRPRVRSRNRVGHRRDFVVNSTDDENGIIPTPTWYMF